MAYRGVFKYLTVMVLPVLVGLSLLSHDWLTLVPLFYVFGLVPLLEYMLPTSTANPSPQEEKRLLASPVFDWLAYCGVPVQYGILLIFLVSLTEPSLSIVTIGGRILAMGLMCGVFGINIAHELGHRSDVFSQRLAQALLLSSLYMHFFIEHNKGHHRKVSTPDDPASSRFNEPLYFFWLRSVIGSYTSAWQLEADRLRRQGRSFWSMANQMLGFQLIQIGLVFIIGIMLGYQVALAFVAAAIIGFLLLETVNYIEHYGLQRQTSPKGYETVGPHHSWNSNHLLGRVMLFELSRHSDHHFKATRKYQILRHLEESPQMPTGYPGMMLLSLIPPLWFRVMNPRVEAYKEKAA
jgi:alkane 1-monooxygenase